jgi:hypothetical protein
MSSLQWSNLKTEQDLKQDEIMLVKEKFIAQKIKAKQLAMTDEDLAMTDEKLKEYGIAQGGLRTAILAVIKSGN